MFALIDGNNFYVSCERAFNPKLAGRPVVVLSNNDGCVISRSNEAKQLGVRMAQPWFECRSLERHHGLIGLSANFALYGDMSERLMTLAAQFAPRQEVYSIDECFLHFEGIKPTELKARCQQLRTHVLRCTGIPTCVGIGPTQTLAKLANHIAKTAERQADKYPTQHAQVCDLGTLDAAERAQLLQTTEVGDVWGIGRKLAPQLHALGLHTAHELSLANPKIIRKLFSVNLERTVLELQGTPCLALEDSPPDKQQIACTRSFGQPVQLESELSQALSTFTSRAAQKLRQRNQVAAAVMLYIRTSPFRPDTPPYSRSITIPLNPPSAHTPTLIKAALAGLGRIYKPGYLYAKAGVMLLDLSPASQQQGDLFSAANPQSTESAGLQDPHTRSQTLMRTLDRLNHKIGQGTIALASAGLRHTPAAWHMRRQRLSPQYTTRWAEMATAWALPLQPEAF